jgi:predicted Zn-dependent peptidase
MRGIHWNFNQENTFSIFISFHVGSAYEPSHLRGIAHMIEHMKFKNNCSPCHQPPKSHVDNNIIRQLEDTGALYNAFTTKDQTMYYVYSIAENAEKVCKLACDIAFHAMFTKQQLHDERKVVLEELYGTKGSMMMELLTSADRSVLHSKNPYTKDPIGVKANIERMTVADLREFHETHYTRNASILVNCSRSLKERIEGILRSHYTPSSSWVDTPLDNVDKTEFSITVKPLASAQYTTIMTFKAWPRSDPRSYFVDMWSYILTNGIKSLLGNELRDKRGLVYNVSTIHKPYQHMGMFNVYFASSNKNTHMLVGTVFDVLENIAKTLSRSSFRKVKKSFLQYKLYSQRQTNIRCEFLATEYFYNPSFSWEDYRAKLEAVSYEDMLQIASELFQKNNVGIVTMGMYDDPYATSDLLVELVANGKI